MADPPRREGASVLRQDEGVRLLKVEADTDKTGGEFKINVEALLTQLV